MTCVAGLIHDGRVWIGADSAGITGQDLRVRSDAKVFHNGPCVIGFAGSFRVGQILRYQFAPPKHPRGMDGHEYMVKLFVTALRITHQVSGCSSKDNEEESFEGDILVGYRGELYQIGADYQVGCYADGFAAIGTGDRVALGVLYVTKGIDPRRRLLKALEAAERFSTSVRAPFVIESSP